MTPDGLTMCGAVFDKDGVQHICTEAVHDGPHVGRSHATSTDLVPAHAKKVDVKGVGPIAVWEAEDLPGVFLAYAYPPHDVMAQGQPNAGVASAIARLRNTCKNSHAWWVHDQHSVAAVK